MITFKASQTQPLLAAFQQLVADGKVHTWKDDGDGWYSHKAPQWAGKAYVHPVDNLGELSFYILMNDDTPRKDRRATYAFFNSHLAESFTTHLYHMFSRAEITSAPHEWDAAKL